MNARQTVCALSMCLISELCLAASLSTYAVRAAGSNNEPLTGGIVLSSPDPISRSTTLSNAFGTADVTMRADAGAVGVESSGSFNAPVLSTRFFPPIASATSSMFVTFSGPTPTVETSINLDFDGFLWRRLSDHVLQRLRILYRLPAKRAHHIATFQSGFFGGRILHHIVHQRALGVREAKRFHHGRRYLPGQLDAQPTPDYPPFVHQIL